MSRAIQIISAAFWAALILAGCSENKAALKESTGRLDSFQAFPVPRPYAKAVSDTRGNTVYALGRESQEIDIFVDGVRVNSIGGLGFGKANFQRLSDIGVDTDGGLLALDSARKLLKKFSSGGMFISELTFDDLSQPELFCVAPDGTLFVYDAAPSEIICYSPLDGREFNRFGRFELDRPVNLDCNKDYLWAHNLEKGSTRVFVLLGQHLATLPQIAALDRSGAYFSAHKPESGAGSGQALLSLNVQGDLVTVLWEQMIWLGRLGYARSSDEAE